MLLANSLQFFARSKVVAAWLTFAIVTVGVPLCEIVQPVAHAAQLTFQWDYTASGAAGFVFYCGPTSGNYLTRIDVGNTETYTITTLKEGATTFCAVTAYDPAKVESTFSNEVSVLVPYTVPSANFSASPTTGAAPLSVSFSNTTAGQVTAWAWDFGDGTTSNVQSPTHVYSTPGSYKVKLTATGPGGTGSMTAASPIVVGALNSNPPVATGLVAAYNFNEGSGAMVTDSSGNNSTGTVFGATWTTAGKYANALSFNGTTSYVDLGNPTTLRLTGSMTWSAWVFATANPTDDGQIVAKGGNSDGWQLKTSPDTGLQTFAVAVSSNGTSHVQRYSKTVRALNTWYHIAGVYNATAKTLDIYVNGVLDNGVLSGTVPAAQVDSVQNANIGRRSGGFYFKGAIDDVRIYNRALSLSEIQLDMNTPVGR
jgi:PKD repeat protein